MTLTDQTFQFHFPTRVIFGAGELQKLPEVIGEFGRRSLLVTTREIVEVGLAARAIGYLEAKGFETVLYDDVMPDPTSIAVDQAITSAGETKPDVIIGLGGGSAMDFAKALAVSSTHSGSIWDYVGYSNRPPEEIKAVTNRAIPVICVPTTSGTGSEVTPYSVLINPDTTQKATINSKYIVPHTAIIDPELTSTLPP